MKKLRFLVNVSIEVSCGQNTFLVSHGQDYVKGSLGTISQAHVYLVEGNISLSPFQCVFATRLMWSMSLTR